MSFIILDREREIRLRNKAIDKIEKRFKKSFMQMAKNPESLTTEEYMFVLYQGLKHEDQQLTLEKTEDLADEYTTMDVIINAITDAMCEAYGMTREEAEAKAKELQEAGNPKPAATAEMTEE